MTELKPCPFCGGEAWMRISDAPQILRVECRRCHAATTSFVADSIGEKEAAAAWNTRTDYHGYEQAAIEAWKSIKKWNTRHVETCKLNELDALTQTLSMVNGCAWGECSECGCLTPDDSTYCINCGRKVEG